MHSNECKLAAHLAHSRVKFVPTGEANRGLWYRKWKAQGRSHDQRLWSMLSMLRQKHYNNILSTLFGTFSFTNKCEEIKYLKRWLSRDLWPG